MDSFEEDLEKKANLDWPAEVDQLDLAGSVVKPKGFGETENLEAYWWLELDWSKTVNLEGSTEIDQLELFGRLVADLDEMEVAWQSSEADLVEKEQTEIDRWSTEAGHVGKKLDAEDDRLSSDAELVGKKLDSEDDRLSSEAGLVEETDAEIVERPSDSELVGQ